MDTTQFRKDTLTLMRGRSSSGNVSPSSIQNLFLEVADVIDSVGSVSAAWGTIGGSIANQTDLQAALNGKSPLAGSGSITAVGTLASGSIPYSLITGAPSSGVTTVFGRAGTVTATNGDYTTAQVTEQTNLYYTNARAIAALLAGYASGAGTLSASDSVLGAIQKLNGNIAALVTGVSTFNTRTGAITLTTADVNAVAATTVGTLTAGSIPYSLLTGTPAIPAVANPTGSTGLAIVNGSATTFMRSDASPSLSQSITPTWTALHTFNINGLGVTVVDGVIIGNSTASLSSGATVQNSPSLRISSTAYGSTLAISQKVEAYWNLTPSTGATPNGTLNLYSQINGGTSNILMTVPLGGGMFTYNTIFQNLNFIGGTSTDGFVFNNSAASSAGTVVQKSTRSRYVASIWNTTATAAANYTGFTQEVSGTSGLVPTGSFDTYGYIGVSSTPTFVKLMSLDAFTGNLTLQSGGLISKGTGSAINSTATATAAQVAGGLITSTSASATSITLPTATLLATQLGITTKGGFDFTVDNSAGASIVTMILGSGTTGLAILTGSNTLTIAAGSVGIFCYCFSSSTAAYFYRIG